MEEAQFQNYLQNKEYDLLILVRNTYPYMDFSNNRDSTAMSRHKNNLTNLGFQTCCEIFNVFSESLESNYETKSKNKQDFRKVEIYFWFYVKSASR